MHGNSNIKFTEENTCTGILWDSMATVYGIQERLQFTWEDTFSYILTRAAGGWFGHR